MKKITKFFSALLALLAVGLITVSLVACSSGDDSKVEADSGKDNSDTKTELVAYKRNTTTSDGDPKTELITFYSDKTFALHETTADYDLDVCDGTYTGDPTKDGKVTATIKRMVSKQKMFEEFMKMGMSGVVTNEHAPLEACAEETMPCTISGNNLYDDEATPMTKIDSNSSESEKTETTTEKSYTVTVTSPSNGTVSADKTSAKKGETVTITASANSGFELLSLTLKDAYENKIEAKADSSKTKYTFTMPDSFVLVNASFGKPYHAKYVWDPSKDPSDGRTGLYDYFVFYTDNTYEYIETVTLGSYSEKETDSAGTYTIDSGDWDNGTITLNATSGKKLNSYTGKCTITNGVFVCDDFTWSNKFTKE